MTVQVRETDAVGFVDVTRCPKRTSAPHSYTRAGTCIDCGALAPELVNLTTGETA